MYLGIDLGTSSLKILLADEEGKIIDKESAEYSIYFPKEKYSEQNPDDWINALVKTIKELGKRHNLKEIEGVSFSGQMHGLVILDENDNVIRPAILWNDNRSVKECEYLNNEIGKEKLIEWTGNIAFTGFTAPKLLWLKSNEPDNFKKIKKIMLPKDYLAYKMSGVFASDVSDNSGTLYFDVKNRKWSKPILDILGITEKQLPKVFESSEVIGTVCKVFSKITGMSEDTKVIIGAGDQAAGAVGTGTVSSDSLSISLGTSGVVFAASDNYAETDGSMHSFCHANGKYHIMGVMLSAAGSLDWWMKKVLKTDDFESELNEIDYKKDSSLYFLPYLIGERSPINDPDAKGMFYGLTMAHTRADMIKAVLEGISLGLKDCYISLKMSGIKSDSARVIGGGAKSDLWLQMLADCLGIKLSTINTTEGGGLGAIILAMTGCGKFETVEKGCIKLIKEEKTYLPESRKTKEYNKKYDYFKALYKSLI
jgi:xylulokinase